jgi:hypothetical protein
MTIEILQVFSFIEMWAQVINIFSIIQQKKSLIHVKIVQKIQYTISWMAILTIVKCP